MQRAPVGCHDPPSDTASSRLVLSRLVCPLGSWTSPPTLFFSISPNSFVPRAGASSSQLHPWRLIHPSDAPNLETPGRPGQPTGLLHCSTAHVLRTAGSSQTPPKAHCPHPRPPPGRAAHRLSVVRPRARRCRFRSHLSRTLRIVFNFFPLRRLCISAASASPPLALFSPSRLQGPR